MDGFTASEDEDSEETPIVIEAEAEVCQWFDEGNEIPGPPVDILDIIKLRLKEVKKFHTPHAYKVFTDLSAVLPYVKLHDDYKCSNHCSKPCLSASLAIARRCGKADGTYMVQQIRTNERHLLTHGRLPPSKKDGLHGHLTLLDNMILGVHKYLAVQALGSITTKEFFQQINEVIVPALGFTGKEATISKRTVRNWLQKLGYSCVEVQKGLYHDSHELPDVVEAQKKFLDQMVLYER